MGDRGRGPRGQRGDSASELRAAGDARRLFGLPLREGEVIADKYRITGLLGQGGMGAVYRAEHARFRREVAIKVLHPMLSRDAMVVRRFEREAQAAGRIGSAHIAEVLDTGTFAGGERYIVMEYLEGESLAARLDRVGTLPVVEVYAIAVQLLQGLAAAHDARFVHRDLKPSNVFLMSSYEGREDFVKILDFGVSKLNTVDAGDVTQTGVLIGTPHYMAPELIRGARHADHRSDLYAVGVILFRSLSGMTPFVAANAYELLHRIGREDAPPVYTFAPDVDEGFAAIVDHALRRDPDARFADAREFIATLEHWSNGAMALRPMRTPSIPPSERPAPFDGSGREGPALPASVPPAGKGADEPASRPPVERPASPTRPRHEDTVTLVWRAPAPLARIAALLALVFAAGVAAALLVPQSRHVSHADSQLAAMGRSLGADVVAVVAEKDAASSSLVASAQEDEIEMIPTPAGPSPVGSSSVGPAAAAASMAPHTPPATAASAAPLSPAKQKTGAKAAAPVVEDVTF